MSALKTRSKKFEKRYQERATALVGIAAGLSERPTPEEIHDLRVTARRVQVMRRLLPRRLRTTQTSRRFELLLRSVLKRTSLVRDLDTLTCTLEEHRTTLPGDLLVMLSNQRSDAAAQAKVACDLLADSLPPSFDPSEIRGKGISTRLRKRAKRHGRAAVELLSEVLRDESKADELHSLRVEIKKLRYLLELSDRAPPELAAVTRWQDSLGAIHDLDVAMDFLRGRDVEMKGQAIDELRRSRHQGYMKFMTECRADSIKAFGGSGVLAVESLQLA